MVQLRLSNNCVIGRRTFIVAFGSVKVYGAGGKAIRREECRRVEGERAGTYAAVDLLGKILDGAGVLSKVGRPAVAAVSSCSNWRNRTWYW